MKVLSSAIRIPFTAASIGIGVFAGFELYGKGWVIWLTALPVASILGYRCIRQFQELKVREADAKPPLDQ